MKLAVFGDIHSNLTAFQACLAFARHLGAEGFVFLGDLVTDGPDPHALIEQLQSLKEKSPCWFVRGNREQYLLDHHKNPNDGWRKSAQTGSLLYTYQHLTADDLKFLQDMPVSQVVHLDGCPPIRACHATPTSIKLTVFPGTERADALLKFIDEDVILQAHSHMQFRYEAGGKQIINPGALGIHRNSMTKAQFALIRCEEGRWIARMLNVDYDRAAELKRYEGSGLPEMAGIWTKLTKLSIATGQDRFEECLSLAHQLAKAEEGQIVPDMYWEAAAKQLGII